MNYAVITDCRTYFKTSLAAIAYGEFTGGTVQMRTADGWETIG